MIPNENFPRDGLPLPMSSALLIIAVVGGGFIYLWWWALSRFVSIAAAAVSSLAVIMRVLSEVSPAHK